MRAFRSPAMVIALCLLPAAPAAGQGGDGDKLFRQRCLMCHTVAPGQAMGAAGPNLAGVVGRKAGATRFAYSPALKGSGLTWDPATLDRYLAGPTKLVPGSRMPIAVVDAGQRAAIVAYLGGLKK